jgi:hypothetical protein
MEEPRSTMAASIEVQTNAVAGVPDQQERVTCDLSRQHAAGFRKLIEMPKTQWKTLEYLRQFCLIAAWVMVD